MPSSTISRNNQSDSGQKSIVFPKDWPEKDPPALRKGSCKITTQRIWLSKDIEQLKHLMEKKTSMHELLQQLPSRCLNADSILAGAQRLAAKHPGLASSIPKLGADIPLSFRTRGKWIMSEAQQAQLVRWGQEPSLPWALIAPKFGLPDGNSARNLCVTLMALHNKTPAARRRGPFSQRLDFANLQISQSQAPVNTQPRLSDQDSLRDDGTGSYYDDDDREDTDSSETSNELKIEKELVGLLQHGTGAGHFSIIGLANELKLPPCSLHGTITELIQVAHLSRDIHVPWDDNEDIERSDGFRRLLGIHRECRDDDPLFHKLTKSSSTPSTVAMTPFIQGTATTHDSTTVPRYLRHVFEEIRVSCAVSEKVEEMAWLWDISLEEVELIADWQIQHNHLQEDSRPKRYRTQRVVTPNKRQRREFLEFIDQLHQESPQDPHESLEGFYEREIARCERVVKNSARKRYA